MNKINPVMAHFVSLNSACNSPPTTYSLDDIKTTIMEAEDARIKKEYSMAFSLFLLAVYKTKHIPGIEGIKWRSICYLKGITIMYEDNKDHGPYIDLTREALTQLKSHDLNEDSFYCYGTLFYNFYKLTNQIDDLMTALSFFQRALESSNNKTKPHILFAVGVCEVSIFQRKFFHEKLNEEDKDRLGYAYNLLEKGLEVCYKTHPLRRDYLEKLAWVHCLLALTSKNPGVYLQRSLKLLEELNTDDLLITALKGIIRYKMSFDSTVFKVEHGILAFVDLQKAVVSFNLGGILSNLSLILGFFTHLPFYLKKATEYMKKADESSRGTVGYQLNLMNYKIHHGLIQRSKSLIKGALKDNLLIATDPMLKGYLKEYNTMTNQCIDYLDEKTICQISWLYNRLCTLYNLSSAAKVIAHHIHLDIPIAENPLG